MTNGYDALLANLDKAAAESLDFMDMPLPCEEPSTTVPCKKPELSEISLISPEPLSEIPSIGVVEQEERETDEILDIPLDRKELVPQKNGKMRQAGAEMPDTAYISHIKAFAEQDLFFFSKAIMGRDYLTQGLHHPICNFLQAHPPHRKMLLLPREHAKTSIVSHCLPLHILVQSKENNAYFPGFPGNENRIMLAGENMKRAMSNLRVIRTALERNSVLRNMWPEVIWERPKRDSNAWNNEAIILPRETEFPDPSVFTIGVDGAVTGARPTVMIKDDLVSVEAANSQVVMQTAIEWHTASRALLEEFEEETGVRSLEFIIGTRWAVHDLYSHIHQNDATVEALVKSIVEEGNPIWPERFTLSRIEDLRLEHGAMFWLLYMNRADDPELTDFDMGCVRNCIVTPKFVQYEVMPGIDEHVQADDDIEVKKEEGEKTLGERCVKIVLNANGWKQFTEHMRIRDQYMRVKYAGK